MIASGSFIVRETHAACYGRVLISQRVLYSPDEHSVAVRGRGNNVLIIPLEQIHSVYPANWPYPLPTSGDTSPW